MNRCILVMVKLYDIAVLNDVLFSFGSGLTSISCAHASFVGNHVIIADDFGADESFLDIGMDFTCSFLGSGAFRDGPRSGLNLSGCQVGDEIECGEGGLDEAVKAGLFEA